MLAKSYKLKHRVTAQAWCFVGFGESQLDKFKFKCILHCWREWVQMRESNEDIRGHSGSMLGGCQRLKVEGRT